jgi:hypothetical protein
MIRAFIIYLRAKVLFCFSSFTFFLFVLFYLLSFYLIYLSLSSSTTLSFFYSLANDHLVDVSLPFSLIRTKLLLMKDFEKKLWTGQLVIFIHPSSIQKDKKKNEKKKLFKKNS